MSKRRTRTSSNTRRSRRWSEESALESALHLVDQFVETLSFRLQEARERRGDSNEKMQTTERATLEEEDAWVDLAAGRRLRREIAAAVSIAAAQIAIVESSATEAIGSAFQQFDAARRCRGAATAPRTRRPRSKQRHASAKFMDELGEMAAEAKEATVYVIADRERLARGLAEARVTAAELRHDAGAATAGSAPRERIMRHVEVCDAQAAYLYQQLLAHTAVTNRLEVELRKLFEQLPEPAATAAARCRGAQGYRQ